MANIVLPKNKIIKKIELLSEKAQKYLLDLLCHKFTNMPIKYELTTEIIELASNGLIKQATKKEDFIEMNISELESCLYLIGESIECEYTKNELIEILMQHKDELAKYYIPVLEFNLQKSICKHLLNKFGLEIF